MNTITYNPSAGTHIGFACKEAVAMAMNKGANVEFKFNDISLTATPESTPALLEAKFAEESQASSERYRNSPEGKLSSRKRGVEIASKQTRIDALVSVLPSIADLDGIVKWIGDFANDADDIGVRYSTAAVQSAIESKGYVANDLCGNPPEFFSTRERMGRYIAGQAISCLKSGMGPHPISLKFCEQYFALPT